MSVKVGNARSAPKPVNGGCPQGSVLGVLLFNVTTDDLEDEPTNTEFMPTVEFPNLLRPQVGSLTSTPVKRAPEPSCEVSPLGGGRF